MTARDRMGLLPPGAPGAVRLHPVARIAAAVVLAYLVLLGVSFYRHGFDATRLIVAGDRFVNRSHLLYPISIEKHSAGYDGQFYYRLSLNPLTTRRTDYGITLDNPVVRTQRIGYPLLAWLLSFGNGYLAPYSLVLINLASLAVTCTLASALLRAHGVATRYAVLFPLYPGFILSLARDTTEIMASCIALGSLLALQRRHFLLASVIASVAVLTRETTLLYLAGFGVTGVLAIVRERRPNLSPLYCLMPLLTYIGWQAILKHVWGSLSVSDLGSHDIELVPFRDYLISMEDFIAVQMNSPVKYRYIYSIFSCALVPLFIAFAARNVVRSPIAWSYAIPFFLYAALAAFFSTAIWNEPYGYVRILSDLYILALIALAAGRKERALQLMRPLVMGTWVATALYAP